MGRISNQFRLILFVCFTVAFTSIFAGCGGVSSSGDPTPTPTPGAQNGYLTWKFNNQRTGLQPNETTLDSGERQRRAVWREIFQSH